MIRKVLVGWFLMVLVSGLSALAQTRVVDASGMPMAGALVSDGNGTPIGLVDKDGAMPSVRKYPVTVRCVGYEDAVLSSPSDTVVMIERPFSLDEVVVRPGERPACRLICYIRETSGLTNGIDTMRLSSQYMVDYMFKAYDKAKKVPTWSKPRVLNCIIDDYSTTGKKVENVDRDIMSWYDIFGQLQYKVDFPESFRGQTAASKSEKSEKTGMDITTYRLTPQQYSIHSDAMADYKDHVFSPTIFKMFGATMDITEMWKTSTFSLSEDETYNVGNLTAVTLSMKAVGRGKLFRYAFFDNHKLPVDIYTYIEIYPVAVEYLTVEEAKELKKDKEITYPMTPRP